MSNWDVGRRIRLRRPGSWRGRSTIVGSALVVLLAAGGVAWATIPDPGTAVIHSCYSKTSGALRVVDPSKGQACKAGEAALSWNGRGLNWRGNWNSTTTYAVADGVTLNGASYVARFANTNSMPPSSSWLLLAGPPYANVFSQSNASNPQTFPVIISSNLTTVAQTTSLPPGNFEVTGQAVVFMDNGAQDVICDLTDSHGNFATGTAETSGPPDSSSSGVVQTLSVTDAFPSEPAGTKILLKCAKANGADSNNSSVSSASLAVNQVGKLVYNGTPFASK